jgi:opacity protein-like surface antigen
MNRTTILSGVLLLAASSFALAGQPVMEDSKKMIIPPEPPPAYGVGWYVGIQGGANLHQSYDGTEKFRFGGQTIAVKTKDEIGGFGGGKIGYGFDGSFIQPAIELDAFYNGVDFDRELRINGNRIASQQGRLDSGAFLANFLIRFNLDAFKPYIGAGAGGWVAGANDVSITVPGVGTFSASNGNNTGGFAWSVIAGADYFFTPKFSVFTEYKYLNYEETHIGGGAVRQQLIGAGLRFFF